MPMSSVILRSYQSSKDIIRGNEVVMETLEAFLDATPGENFLTPLTYYLTLLEKTNRVTFLYMNAEQKELTLRNLQITYLLLLAQTQAEKNQGKKDNVKTYQDHIQHCSMLIDALLLPKACKDKEQLATPELDQTSDGHPVSYLGIPLGQFIANKIVAVADRKTKTIEDAMGWFNEKRLYWVWGSGLLKTILSLIPEDFYNSGSANQTLHLPDPYTGCISWGLYYFRFALNLGLLLKHTITGPWMSAEERNAPAAWTDRFITQWEQRKFALLNDLVWATGNIVCFFILNSKKGLGPWGDLLTAGLLVFDITLAAWDFAEQETQHNKELLEFDANIKRLQTMIAIATSDQESDKEDCPKIAELRLQIAALEQAKLQAEKNWTLKKLVLINTTAYTVGLMLSFILLTMPFLPLSSGALLIIGTAGAVLCFALSVIYNAVKNGLEVYKAYFSAQDAQQAYLLKIEVFKSLLISNPNLDDPSKKLLFLEIKGLLADSEYQRGLMVLNTMHLIRSVIFESVVPAIIFTTLVFFPMGVSLAMIGGVLALALGTNILINRLFTPKKGEVTELDETEYKAFCDHLESDKKLTNRGPTFFPKTDDPTIKAEPDGASPSPLVG